MRAHRFTLGLPVLVALALVGAAIPAGAGPTDAEQRFCDKYQESSSIPTAEDADGSANEGDLYRDLAEVAPTKKIKKSLKTIAKYFDKLEDIDANDQGAAADLFSSALYAKYIKAGSKFTTYVTETCSFELTP